MHTSYEGINSQPDVQVFFGGVQGRQPLTGRGGRGERMLSVEVSTGDRVADIALRVGLIPTFSFSPNHPKGWRAFTIMGLHNCVDTYMIGEKKRL